MKVGGRVAAEIRKRPGQGAQVTVPAGSLVFEGSQNKIPDSRIYFSYPVLILFFQLGIRLFQLRFHSVLSQLFAVEMQTDCSFYKRESTESEA